jgi:hypothetical protein
MKNLGQMLKQAQEMQARMQKMQAELEAREVTGVAGGGLVSVVLNGKGQMRRIAIDKSLANPDDTEMLEDLIVAAHNDAKAKIESETAQAMSDLTSGLKLPPGMKLPF